MAPAVINAIEHGLGIEIDKLPATPERILKAMNDFF
jgi:CO/xanthine dehydrogenase Mo-binding subunit